LSYGRTLSRDSRTGTSLPGREGERAMSQQVLPEHIPPMSHAPPGYVLDERFAAFYRPLHEAFAARAHSHVAARKVALEASLAGKRPDYLVRSEAGGEWQIELPWFTADQRNQMTGPADDHELVVKMLNSGAPGVMIDLEDSMVNAFEHTMRGIDNAVAAYYGELTYIDAKRSNTKVGIDDPQSPAVLWTRVRGLHLSQAGVIHEPTPAPLFDLALLAWKLDFSRLKHPLAIYIPKTEAAEEAQWWRDVFEAIAFAKELKPNAIKCMALVESHPFAYQIEEFAYILRDHLVGLNLGRWDYMASLIHFNFNDPAWVLPDRNTIPTDVPFFQALRERIPEICHKHGMLAIGGMTALFPDRSNPQHNAQALQVLAEDKKNEATCLFDGAWTGHPDQNKIAVEQFPAPNQDFARKPGANPTPDLRPIKKVGTTTIVGTRAAIRTAIRYRHGYLSGLGASLLDGYMEDLATDRIYRLMIAQRIRHGLHKPQDVTRLFDEELARLLVNPANLKEAAHYREARRISEEMIRSGFHDPI
jgi:malate synthase